MHKNANLVKENSCFSDKTLNQRKVMMIKETLRRR